MKVTARANIKNRFDIEVKDIVTGEIQNYQAHNIVLDAMWSRLVNFQTFFVNIHFGTGTGTLAPTRTSLFTHLGTKAATDTASARALPTSHRQRQIVLNPEEHVGSVITEVGVAFGATSTNLVTHAFLEDSEGNPISITKTDTMVVTIYATIFFELGALTDMYGGKWRWVMPLANNELLSYLLGGTYPTQQFRVTLARGFGLGTACVSHGQSAAILVADWTRDAANKRVTTPVRRLGITIGNGAVRGFGLGSSDVLGAFRGQFPIPGVHTSRAISETLGTGDGVRTAWDLLWNEAVPGSVTVRVDGVPAAPTVNELISYVGARLNNPAALPAGNGYGAAFSPDGVYLAIAHSTSPFVTIYRRDGNTFTRLSNPAALPAGTGLSAAFSPDGVHLAIVHSTSPFMSVYDGAYSTGRTHNIIFASPPALGTTITAEYAIPYIPKDANHVLDLQCRIQYGEPV